MLASGALVGATASFLNYRISLSNDDLAHWKGYGAAIIFRMMALLAFGTSYSVVSAENKFQPGHFLAFAAIIFAGIIIDTFFSLQRLKKLDEA